MKVRHASEVAAQKAVWRQLAVEREKVWSDYRKEFATPEPQQDKGDQQQSHREEFREAASGTAKSERERRADQNRGNGADRAPRYFEKSPRRDWRARRSAASAKPMDRTRSETEARMTAAVAGSAIGMIAIDRLHTPVGCPKSRFIMRYWKHLAPGSQKAA